MDDITKLNAIMARIRELDHGYSQQLQQAAPGERASVFEAWEADAELEELSPAADAILVRLKAQRDANEQ